MARRERVGSTSGIEAPRQQQTPWFQAAAAASIEPDPAQHTEIAAFARSPSPATSAHEDTADDLGNEAEEQKGRNVSSNAGQATGSSAAEQLHAESPQLKGSELLASARQMRATRDLPKHSKGHAQRRTQRTGTADIHMIGELTGAVGFGDAALYCTWQLVYDNQLWKVTSGLAQGRTHASSPMWPEDGILSGIVWETPLDFMLTTTSIQHWPQIVFKLFHRSIWLGRDEFVGYSLCNLPSTPGCHHLSCPVWAAVEARRSFQHEITRWFTGLTPQLVDESFITDLEQRYEQGQHLHTVDCSSSRSGWLSSWQTPASLPTALAVDCKSTTSIGSSYYSNVRYCRAFSAAGAGGTAAPGPAGLAGAQPGGRICLRLHVLSRGLSQLRVLGGESVGKALERLRESVEQMRRQKGQHATQDEEDDDDSEGVRLVREGRASRLAAIQQNLDNSRDRDQQRMQDSSSISPAPGSEAGSAAASSGSRRVASPNRASPYRSSRSQHEGSGSPADIDGRPSRPSRAGRLGTGGRLTTSTAGTSAPGVMPSPNAPAAGGVSPDASRQSARESSGARRQLYGSPLLGTGPEVKTAGSVRAADAGLERGLPPPRFAVAGSLRRRADLLVSSCSEWPDVGG